MCMSFLTATFAVTIISFLVCLFWLQKRGWHFVASATIMCMSFLTAQFAITIISFLVCLFWLQKRGWHFVASATIMCMTLPHFWQEHPFVAYVRGIRACSLVSIDILCVSSDHNIHTEHFRMSRCHASRRTCFCDTKRLCVCTVHSSWLSSRHVISLPKKFRSLRHVDLGACGFSAPASEMSSPF